DKIKVPPPTFCSDCRLQRRLSFRNTHSLYKRKDSFNGKDILSIYSPDKKLVVIDQKDWWKDGWDPFDYGVDYDFSKSFFSQWKELRDTVPLQSLSNSKAVNSEYCNVAEESYDCYLISASWKCERVMYSDSIHIIKDSMDLHVVFRSEFCYADVSCADSYRLFYSQDSYACTDSYFLYDCRGCTDCFMSSNLRNKSYVFKNEQLSKEAYKEKIKELNLGSFTEIQEFKKEFNDMKLNSVHRFAQILNSYNVTGDNVDHAKNCSYCFNVTDGLEDCKNIFWGGMKAKEVFDSGPGVGDGQLMYEVFDTGIGAFKNLFTSVVYNSIDVEYSFNCYNCSYCFGCLGLRNKKFCILNKQYTKEEYEDILPKIKKHMSGMPYVDNQGRIYKYGEFFPVELSPFCYNETVAQEYFHLSKEQAISQGFLWKDKEVRSYMPTINSADLPDDIQDASEDILNDIILCGHKGECADRCTSAFKVTRDELSFYKRFDIPIPRLCYGCRFAQYFKMRNPLKLWNRKCMHEGCDNEFQTSYAPDRPEIIYCEKCYQQEVI
ncbi:MAG: hypothetical protein KBB62_01930, partial [Candidatus Pacebacteria bacterium]|nr:hypothetical protein [Candidatus Paceibacterota bacterium]